MSKAKDEYYAQIQTQDYKNIVVNNYIKELEQQLAKEPCEKCKWFDGKNTMCGICSGWPCESCRNDNFEPIEEALK